MASTLVITAFSTLFLTLAIFLAHSSSYAGEMARTGQAQANADCAIALAYSKITGDIHINCTRYQQDLAPVVTQITNIKKKQKLGQSQLVALLDAVNVMVSTVVRQQEQMSKDISAIREELPKQVTLGVAEVIEARLVHVADGRKTIDTLQTEAREWRSRYEKLAQEMEAINLGSERWKQARDAILQGNLERAGQLLDQAIAEEERHEKEQRQQLAQMYSQRAEVLDLQFNIDDARS